MNHLTNRRMVTVAMMVAVLLVAIDVTVVSTAMPRIVADLSGINLFSWVFAIYTLTTSVTTPIYGKLADLYGRKIVFTVGVVIFLVGSMLSGLSQTMMELIFFRALQGIGAGAVMPITFTIIGDLFSGEARGKMQGLFSSVWGVAGILGPLLGGFFVDYMSWRWIFYINLPIGIISLTLVWMYLHESFERRQHKVDYLGAVLFTASISSLLYALLNGGKANYAWTSATILSLFTVAVVGLILFFVVESRAREPILPLPLFKMRIIAVSNLASFLASAVLIATQVYLPMWIQSILGHSATSSGLTLMPMSIGWPLAATIGGRLMYKVGSKATAVLGGVFILVGCLWLATVNVNAPYWYLIAIMVIIGLGMGFSMTPFTVLIQASVPWRMRGAATASNTFMRTLGQTMGVAIYGTWFNHAVSQSIRSHFGKAGPPKDFSKLLSPGAVHTHVPKNVLSAVQGILSHSLHTVFLVVAVTAILTLLSIFLLPLHKTVMQQQVTE